MYANIIDQERGVFMKTEEMKEKLELKLMAYKGTKGKITFGWLVVFIGFAAFCVECFAFLSGKVAIGSLWYLLLLCIHGFSAGHSFKLNEERAIKLSCIKGQIESIAYSLGLNLTIDELLELLMKNKLQDMISDVRLKKNNVSISESNQELSISNKKEENVVSPCEDMPFKYVYSSVKNDLHTVENQEESKWNVMITDPSDKSSVVVSKDFYDQHIASLMDESNGISRKRVKSGTHLKK